MKKGLGERVRGVKGGQFLGFRMKVKKEEKKTKKGGRGVKGGQFLGFRMKVKKIREKETLGCENVT